MADREEVQLSGDPEARRFTLISQIAEGVLRLLTVIAICATVAFVFWVISTVLLAYAGTSTFANVAITVVTDFKLDRILSYAFGAGGISYGLKQRQLRRQNIARLTPRSQALEKRIDAGRTSSDLNPDGTTRSGDRP